MKGAAVGGTVIAATGPEMLLTARLALAGCKSNPVLCLNQAGIYAADIAAPEAAVGTGSLLAGSTILVGKSQEEAVQFGRQVVAASGNLLKDGKANQGKLGEFIAGKGVAEGNLSGELTGITQKQLDKKFKHAIDFGVITTMKNPQTLAQYEAAIKNHMNDIATIEKGVYGFVKDSKVFFNSKTNNAVFFRCLR